MNARSEFSRGLRARLLAVLAGLLCTVPSLAATMDRVDKGYWLTVDYQSLSTRTATGIVEKVAPTRSDVRFRNLHEKLPPQMRGKVLTAEGLARTHLGLLDAIGAKRATQDTLKLANVSPLRNGAQIVRFRSEVGGIEVFRGDISILLDGNQSLRAISGVWPSVPPKALDKAVPTYRLSAEQALGHSLTSYGFSNSAVVAGTQRAPAEGGYVSLTVSSSLRGTTDEQVHSARAKQVLFPSNDSLIPAWYVETVVGQRGVPDSEYYSHVIDAVSGDVLFRHNQTEYEDYQYNVWAEGAGFLPYPGPQGRQATPYPGTSDQGLTPSAVPTELITLQNVPFSMNDPWLPDGAAVTTGNNTEAYTDAGTEGFTPADGDIRGTAFTAGGPVPPPYDPTLEPNASDVQRAAAVRQMFYFVNWTHDWYYDAGFDEISGNAQANNFGRGGTGSDSVKAEGQDNSNYPGNDCFPNCSNNANMSTPADGGRPRMQMFTWSPVGAASFTRHTPLPAHVSGGVGTPGWSSTPFNLTDDIVQAIDVAGDGDANDGTTTDGCSAFTNAAAVSGNIAFADRGSCGFAIKVQNAFAAGATGIVIGNIASSAAPGSMGGTPTSGLNLPALLINFADATDLRDALTSDPGAVTGTLLRAAGVRPDGTVDNQIMAHELGHYVSNRLVHNSAGLTTNHSRGLGEGWGDFHAQLMTVKEDDLSVAFGADYAGVYGMAAYSTGNYWAGIRSFPYTTNLAINPLTYGDLITRTQVHAAGEIWASSLWQCYAGILNSGLTFADAQQRMKEYLIAGYKLTPPGPFFTEARDAVLAAIIASGETEDFEVCAAGFATRGAGIYAVPPNDRNGATNAGVVEDFTIDGKITLDDIGGIDDSAAACDIDGVLDVGEEGLINLPFNNVGWLSLSNSEVQVSSDFGGLVFPDGATYVVPNTVPYQSETVQIPVRLDSAPAGDVTLTFTASDPDVGIAPTPLVVPIAMNFDYVLAASDTFDTSTFDTSILGWHTLEEFGATSTKKWVKRTVSGAQVAFGTDIGTAGVAWLETPAIEAGPASLEVQLSHRYSFEAGAEPDGNYDGGVVEISVNGGAWTELDLPEYTNTLSNCCGNPMAGRDAFTLDSAGYPAFTNLTIDLGTTYNGSNVRLRFGVAEDASAAGVGWDIDTVTVTGALNQPFPVGTGPQVVDCTTNTGPVAVDDSLTVLAGGSASVLDGGATTVQANDTDAEDGVPTGIVELVTDVAAGNSLTLNTDGTFSYTDGTDADDSFTYTVQDSDGNVSDPATVVIVVNHAPTVAAALGDRTDDEGDVINVSLAGVFADSDSDDLTFSAGTLPANISVVGDALVGTLNANSADDSPYTIVVTADDGRGGTVQDSFEWTINDTEGNTPPTVVGPIADQIDIEGDAVNIDLASHFDDADGDVLSFSADVLPPGVSIVGGAITGTLSLASAGSYSVTITADDSFDLGTVSAPAFTWDVVPSATIGTPANVTVAQLWVGDTAAPTFDIGNTGDAGAPDLVWTISESTDSCATTGANSVPWFSATPAAGSTAQGGTTPVTVNIDTAGLTHGANVQASLCVSSNDPAMPVRNVPVIITTLRPAHDLFARAKPVTVDGGGLYADVVATAQLATTATGVINGAPPVDPSYACRAPAGTGSQSYWYSLIPGDDGLLSVNTLGSTGSYSDTVLQVLTYNGSAFTAVACNDDISPSEFRSSVTDLRLDGGTTYYIEVSRYSGAVSAVAGQLNLNVDFQAFTGEAAMTLAPTAINTSVPSGATTFRDLAIGNENTGDRPLEWEIVDQSLGWLSQAPAELVRPVTQLDTASRAGVPVLSTAGSVLAAELPAQSPSADLTVAANLTQNSALTLTNLFCVAPTGGFNIRWLRAFTLADYGIAADYDFTGVTFAFVGATSPVEAERTATITVYELTGDDFTYANMVPVASTTQTFAQSITPAFVTVPLVGTVQAGKTLVLEVSTPVQSANPITEATCNTTAADGGYYLQLGYNQAAESAPGYVASDNGFITASGQPYTEPVAMSALSGGNPASPWNTLKLVMRVNGGLTCDTPTELNWLDVDALSGEVAAGTQQDITFTLGDGALPDGDYSANLCVASNDPAQQIVGLPVTLAVGEMPEITVDPLELDATAAEGESVVQTLTIGNEGASGLIWNVAAEELPGLGVTDLQARSSSSDVGRMHPVVAQTRAPGDVIFESFEAGVPPVGWTVESLAPAPVAPWATNTIAPHHGTNSASAPWSFDDETVHDRDEWLLSPVLDMTMANVSFWSGGSPFWCRDDNDNCDLEVWVVVDAIGGGDDILVGTADESWPAGTPFVWAQSSFDLTPHLTGGDFRIGFRYVGADGAETKIDSITITDTNPVACADATGAPWLSFDLSDGVVAAGASQDVNVTFNAATLTEGLYEANVCVASNDNDEPVVAVPTSFTVTFDPPAIELDPASLSYDLVSGDSASQDVTITNIGSPTLDWELLVSSGAVLEELNIGNVTTNTGGGAPVSFSIPAGVANSGTVVGFRFEGDLTQAINTSWGSDTCMVVTAPTGEKFGVGGFDGLQPECLINTWQFDDGGVEDFYTSDHDNAFAPGVGDAGNWTFSFTNDWEDATAAIIWDNVKITLVKVQNVPAGCDLLDSVPWLSTASVTSGSLGAAEFDVVALEADATGLGSGTYNANLCFASNDTTTPVAELPVELIVGAPQITIDPLAIDLAAAVDGSDSADLTIGNEGDADLSWTLASDEIPAPLASLTEVEIVRGLYGTRGPAVAGLSRTTEGGTIVTAGTRRVRVPTRGVQYDVLLVTPDTLIDPDGQGPQFMVDELNNFPDINAQLNTVPVGNLTAADLAPYDLVIISNNNQWGATTPASDVAVGNALADYIDDGGKAIVFQFAYDWDAWNLSGRFITENYGPFTVSTTDSGTDVTMVANVPGSPVLAGVSAVAYTGLHQNVGLQPGAELIASWSNGNPFVAANDNVIAINALYAISDETTGAPVTTWTGDLDVLLHNAILELAPAPFCEAPVSVSWLSANPAAGTTTPGMTSLSAIAADATGLAVGTYTANLCVASNDPINPLVVVPVTLTVTVATNSAPVLTAAATADYAENGTGAVLTASATDAEDDVADLTFDLTGPDANLFVFDPVSGELDFLASPDFENPTDAGGDNVYDVTLTVTDTDGLTDTQAIAITVTDVNEAPVSGTVADVSVQFGTVVSINAGAAFTDPDGDDLAFALSSTPGLPASLSIDADTGVISGTPLEADIGSYEITVTATDPDGEETSLTFTLTVLGESIFGDGFED